MMMMEIARRFRREMQKIDQNRAIMISNAVWKAVKKK
jgi:hypothetical protein